MARWTRPASFGAMLGGVAGVGLGLGASAIERSLHGGTGPGTLRPGQLEIVLLAVALGVVGGGIMAALLDATLRPAYPTGRGTQVVSLGALIGLATGGAAGVLLGLAHPPTVAFAVAELGIPGALAGVLIGVLIELVIRLVAIVNRRAPRAR